MKKGTIKCHTKEGFVECEGQIMSEQWGIHLDPFIEKGKHYVLTHIPSGKRVWSSSKMTNLKRLIQEPEFLEKIDDTNLEDVKKLKTAIERFCEEYGWK